MDVTPIHPFPARMAPETVTSWLDELPTGAKVLDPMCGSGVVVRQSALRGHSVRGFDIDPLAVLMSSVWTRKGGFGALSEEARELVKMAKSRPRLTYRKLEWIAGCKETRDFIDFWFAEPQKTQLARLAFAIQQWRGFERSWLCDCFDLALSRTIVTKHVGASLAWDVSHSRPHKKRTTNDYDVYGGFLRSIDRLQSILEAQPVARAGVIQRGDCRNLGTIKQNSIDAVITSPPYLNAIDYLRGHRLALVWMRHSIPTLRNLRSASVGTERAGNIMDVAEVSELEDDVRSIKRLPRRQRGIVHKYAHDADLFLKEMSRLMKPGGLLVLVLGNSKLRGVPIHNSRIFRYFAERNGFDLRTERQRRLKSDRRYLPISSNNNPLSNRMRTEVIQSYRLSSSA